MFRNWRLIVPLALALMFSACAPSKVAEPSPTSPAVVDAPLSEETATSEPEAIEPMEPAATAAGVNEAADGTVLFTIVPEASEARFYIDEILAGSPNKVVGVTNRVSGEIRLNPDQPSFAEVGTIRIDTGSLTTDNDFRNGAIRRAILQTGEFPEVTFAPTAMEGLPAQVAVGDEFSFSITGDLTVRDVVRPVTFDVNVRAESADRLTGLAKATVLRSDFGLTIPSVPNVADVSEEVILEFEFTAVAAS
jgi:polyisoprenoid-binding protein YceI